jgi:hypothetical protein
VVAAAQRHLAGWCAHLRTKARPQGGFLLPWSPLTACAAMRAGGLSGVFGWGVNPPRRRTAWRPRCGRLSPAVYLFRASWGRNGLARASALQGAAAAESARALPARADCVANSLGTRIARFDCRQAGWEQASDSSAVLWSSAELRLGGAPQRADDDAAIRRAESVRRSGLRPVSSYGSSATTGAGPARRRETRPSRSDAAYEALH